jgi:hypothetical protein
MHWSASFFQKTAIDEGEVECLMRDEMNMTAHLEPVSRANKYNSSISSTDAIHFREKWCKYSTLHYIAPAFPTAAEAASSNKCIDFIDEQNTRSTSTRSRKQRSNNCLCFTDITTKYFRSAASVSRTKMLDEDMFHEEMMCCVEDDLQAKVIHK